MLSTPAAAMLGSKLFVSRFHGPVPDLFERWWDGTEWVWVDHGRPDGQAMGTGPGAAMLDSKLFVVTEAGNLWERDWRPDLGRWAWQDHGRPPGGARAATAPGAAMLSSKLFVGTDDSHLWERYWTGETWTWVDHGTAYADTSSHVIGAPGRGPAITVAVMGDGFAEGDLGTYRQLVTDKVVKAFGFAPLDAHQDRLRVVRIDVVSPVTGVTERRYDEHGTTDTAADDTLTSETYRFSRLGLIGTGLWSHCWIETSDRTNPRIESIRRRFVPDAGFVVVLVNSPTFGGCARGTMSAFTVGVDPVVVAHEMGHNIFGLGDEYHNGSSAFTGVATDANLSEIATPRASLKWGTLVDPATPLPTLETALPSGWDRRTSVGAFEGGGGSFATGIFHPVLECRMNQNNPPWCPVCTREIERIFGSL